MKRTTKILIGCIVVAAIFFGFLHVDFSSLYSAMESLLSRGMANGDKTDAVPVYNGDYRLIFEENFDEDTLNPAIWNDQYLASWTPDMDAARAVYEVADGNLNLIINEDTQPWNPEFDGTVRTSSVMTGNRTGLHEFKAGLEVRNDIEPLMGFITQYGVFEIRAKMMNSFGNMCAWWLVGIQDTPEQDVEVDVFENALNFGNVITASLYAHRDPVVREQHFIYDVGDADLSNEFHLYTFEWTPEGFIVYFDDEEIGTFQAEVAYPMISILSAYEGRENWWVGPFDPAAPYPKVFQIDYMKVWKKVPDDHEQVDELKIVSQDEAVFSLNAGQYAVEHGQLVGFPSYVTLRYNDGTGTQQWVKRQELTPAILEQLEKPGTFKLEGEIIGVPEAAIGNRKATVQVKLSTEGLPETTKHQPDCSSVGR
ncbi:glycoside hydrolase family 16 protein [Trichococcus shcherbakoviae]|uniref:glycoside hydrolase family 16 protein n=1 Tax=Trichococcus shcherbakoviae TaxID=2094020 RepID=UPI0029F589D8|nr:glycoside hydrolase family 16 protein [Trichococcus shcherbakoviae]